MFSRPILKNGIVILLILLNLGCDQISKDIVRKQIAPSDYIQVYKDYFILSNVENTGAMLGFGQNLSPLLKLIFLQGLPLIVLLILLFRLLYNNKNKFPITVAFSFLIGGGLSNLIDRIRYGSVTDFVQLKLSFFKTGIFNLADVSVTIGILLIIGLSFYKKNNTTREN